MGSWSSQGQTFRISGPSNIGEDGPSQGSSAPGAGRSGQCQTSADCASRVPYCSELGYCHGGTLPFDEAQLEIEDSQKNAAPDQRPIGYVNNNPRKNSPVFAQNGSGGGNNNNRGNDNNGGNQRKGASQGRNKASSTVSTSSGGGGCPGSLQEC